MPLIDEILKDAIERGDFSNLPGEGKPFKLEDESHIPEHLRIAHRILRDNDLAPDWIMDGNEIVELTDRTLRDIRAAVRRYRRDLKAAALSMQPNINCQKVEDAWALRLAELHEQSATVNKLVLTYNLKVPLGVQHKMMINLEQVIAKVV